MRAQEDARADAAALVAQARASARPAAGIIATDRFPMIAAIGSASRWMETDDWFAYRQTLRAALDEAQVSLEHSLERGILWVVDEARWTQKDLLNSDSFDVAVDDLYEPRVG